MRGPRNAAIAAVLAAATSGLAPTPSTAAHRPAAAIAASSGCTIRIVSFNLIAARLQEQIDAHWRYGTPDLDGRAIVQTTQRMEATWRGKQRAVAAFTEDTGQCRVGDRFQGRIKAVVPNVQTHVDGTWGAGQRSGTCSGDATGPRAIPAQFIRRTLATDPPARTIGVEWSFPQPRQLDCPFTAFNAGFGEYQPQHLRSVQFAYPSPTQVIPKSALLGRPGTLRLSVRLAAHAHRMYGLPPWSDGTVAASLTLSAAITLQRYKDCTIHPGDKILGNPCLKP